MNVYYEKEVEGSFDFDEEEVAEAACAGALKCCGIDRDCQVSVTLTDSEGIKEINSQFRGIDSETDVLSFPMIEFDTPAEEECITEDCLDPDTGLVNLGDIMLCHERICSQAADFGHSEKREFAFLIVHSMLHLLGYDHMTDEDRIPMEEKQRQVMEYLGIMR